MSTKLLHDLSMTELVDLHNSYEKYELRDTVHKPCTTKTFNSKEKIINRIKFYEDRKKPIGILWDKGTGKTPRALNGHAKQGTITELANRLILRPEGHSYKEILGLIRDEFPEAGTSLNCLRWYAAKLRTKGQAVPKRVHGKAKITT